MRKNSATPIQDIAGLDSLFDQVSELGQDAADKILELTCLYKLAAQLSGTMNVNSILQAFKEIVRENFDLDQYGLYLIEGQPKEFALQASAGVTAYGAFPKRAPLDHALLGKAIAENDVVCLASFPGGTEALSAHLGLQAEDGALLFIPLFSAAKTALGVIVLFKASAGSFPASEIRFFRKMAIQMARALERALLFQHTKALSFTDELTGIFNRRYFNQRFEREMLRAIRYNRPLSVLMVDIDHFKAFNDSNGHIQGDKILRSVTRILDKNLRKADILSRFGGEEFVILLPEIDKAHAMNVAEKLRRAIESTSFPRAKSQPGGKITISIGLSSYPEDAMIGEDLLELADKGLYLAKSQGRNRVCVAKNSRRGGKSGYDYRFTAAAGSSG